MGNSQPQPKGNKASLPLAAYMVPLFVFTVKNPFLICISWSIIGLLDNICSAEQILNSPSPK